MGRDTTASGYSSMAMGRNTTASGTDSMAMGDRTTASGMYSTAMGFNATASGMYSIAIGEFVVAESRDETVIGAWNIPSGGNPSGWLSSDPLFVIGNGYVLGYGEDRRSNAVVVLKNGNMGIGTSTPEVPLHVDSGSDCSPDSGGYLVVNGTGTNSSNLCIDNNEIMARYNGEVADLLLNNGGGHTVIGGTLLVNDLTSVSATPLCVTTDGTLASCSSSERYKEAVEPLPLGLRTVEQLKPVSFKWKDRDERGLGFIAEQIAAIDPLLVTYNKDGEIQGVKYPQLTAVLVNAIQEQQRQYIVQERRLLTQQAETISQQQQIASLREELQQYRSLASEVASIKRQLAQSQQLLVSHLK